MDRLREDIVDKRADTDASLDAERVSADSAAARAAAKAQRALDDLIERDRIIADERLRAFRRRADEEVALERAAVSARGGSVASERETADEDKKAERGVTDVLLERERERADAAIDAARREREAARIQLEECRRRTDDQLSSERDVADHAVGALDDAADEQLAQGNREHDTQEDALGMVAHELRNPLAVIAANAECIALETSEASTREMAQEVMRSSARMDRLLSDLVDVARIESGTMRIVKRRNDAGALLSEVLRSYRPLFTTREMTFDVTVPTAPVVGWFDRDRIVQVLSNLLGNAMKFTPAGGTVRLGVEQHGEHLEFTLENSGPGIQPDALCHVFERFWQADGSKHRGLGLGLYICQKIMEAHGGRIWVESALGVGMTFRFSLPVH